MKLKKTLGVHHVFSIAAGAMVSSGIFILPGLAFARTGPSVFLSYGLAGLVAFIGVLSVIELATAMPRAGGDYYFIGRTFGPLMGSVTGLLSWTALTLKTAFAVFGLSEILVVLTGIDGRIWGLVLTGVFVTLNLVGVEETAGVEVVLVSMLILIMGAFIILGFGRIEAARFTPFFAVDANGMVATAAFVFVAYGGLLQIATVSEEVKRPQTDIQRGTFAAVIVVTVLYVGVVAVTTGLLPAESFRRSFTPVADAAEILGGRPAWIVVSVGAALAFITTGLAGLMAASRYPLALSRDRLLPGLLSRTSRKRGIPATSVLLTGLLVILALQVNLEFLVKSASAVFMVNTILANVAVIVLRESRLSHYRPLYRAPMYPWTQLASILIFLFLLADMGPAVFGTALLFVLFGILVYRFYGRRRADHDFALVHLLKRLVDSRWRDEGLDEELLDILRHRDRPAGLRESGVLDSMVVADLDEQTTPESLRIRASQDLAGILEVSPKMIVDALRRREAEVAPAINRFTAIPTR